MVGFSGLGGRLQRFCSEEETRMQGFGWKVFWRLPGCVVFILASFNNDWPFQVKISQSKGHFTFMILCLKIITFLIIRKMMIDFVSF